MGQLPSRTMSPLSWSTSSISVPGSVTGRGTRGILEGVGEPCEGSGGDLENEMVTAGAEAFLAIVSYNLRKVADERREPIEHLRSV
jgi:hypothetical protein